MTGRVRLAVLVVAALLCGWGPLAAMAAAAEPDLHYFRIGTGTNSDTDFTAGGLIATAITNPPGSWPCDRGGSCGVPGLIGVAQATTGGLNNLELLRAGAIEAALVQAPLAAAAFLGQRPGRPAPPFADLRLLAPLFTDTVQIVVRADSEIRVLADLHGRTIGVGPANSASATDARIILGGLGLGDRSTTAVALPPDAAVDRLVEGSLNAVFLVGAAPLATLSDAARHTSIRLIPIDPGLSGSLRRSQPLFTSAEIAADTYPGVPATPTLGVEALLVVRADLDDTLAYGVTQALWLASTRRSFEASFPNVDFLPMPTPGVTAPVPFHDGAARFYRDTLSAPQ